jgi:hypothetical protein
MKVSFREIANHITGFEIPVFGGGLSWNPPTLDIEVARRLLTFLEDRRALYQPYECETANYVVKSILEIRQRLTGDLEQLDRGSPLAQSLTAMRAACRKFLDDVEGTDPHMSTYHRHRRWWDEDERNFFMSLGELRAVMGIHIAGIAVRYGIDVEEELAAIFPASPGEQRNSRTRGRYSPGLASD